MPTYMKTYYVKGLDPTHQNKECSWDREQGPKKTMLVGFSFKENLKFWFDTSKLYGRFLGASSSVIFQNFKPCNSKFGIIFQITTLDLTILKLGLVLCTLRQIQDMVAHFWIHGVNFLIIRFKIYWTFIMNHKKINFLIW